MKKGRILITGEDQDSMIALAQTLHSGFSAKGIKSAIVKLDEDHPTEGNKAVGYEVSLHTDFIILVGCLDTPKDMARYKRIARIKTKKTKEDCYYINLKKTCLD